MHNEVDSSAQSSISHQQIDIWKTGSVWQGKVRPFDRAKFVRATSFIKVFMPWVATKEFTIYHSISVDVVQEFVFLFIQYA